MMMIRVGQPAKVEEGEGLGMPAAISNLYSEINILSCPDYLRLYRLHVAV